MQNHLGRKIQIKNPGEFSNETYLKYTTLENAVSSFPDD